ncbi:DHH family phosphoesterase [Marinilabilia sp.]|uniref:DHH family phosphoesterase n=1 Tax=Marinilabilia sp. TaxID=2021252 RepID=UPI0025C12F90|nr:DHH family phosphoesterase [Marinilabilia sp.]
MDFNNEHLSRLRELIDNASSIILIPHKNSDGDAIGSILGWWNVLRGKGKNATVIVPDDVPENLRWMHGTPEIMVHEKDREKAKTFLSQADLLMFLDFNDVKRTGDMAADLSGLSARRVMIDHHPDPVDGVADVMFSEVSVSSTCELSYHLMNALEWNPLIEMKAAECLYAGIITDTGVLSYNSSNPPTYLAVADLVTKGIDKSKIHKELFQSNSLGRMRLLGHVLCNKLELMEESGTAFISLSLDELEKHGYQPGDTEGFVNYPLGIKGMEISAMFTEKEKDKFVKISFRSRDDMPVNIYSQQFFSGGGHANAAGGEWKGTLDEAIKKFKDTLPEFVQKIKNR